MGERAEKTASDVLPHARAHVPTETRVGMVGTMPTGPSRGTMATARPRRQRSCLGWWEQNGVITQAEQQVQFASGNAGVKNRLVRHDCRVPPTRGEPKAKERRGEE